VTKKTMDFDDAELELLIECLADRYEDKVRALATATENKFPFTERDFGMPQINALLLRVESVYNADEVDEVHYMPEVRS
jgi:hypothetical protein